MRVLHFIDNNVKTAGNETFDYLPALLREMAKASDVVLITPRNIPDFEYCEAKKVIRYSSSLFMAMANRRRFGQYLDKEKPEIVHVHGCESFVSSVFMNQCVKRSIPVIITTGKNFEPWNIRQGYWTNRLARLIIYQRNMIRSACAVHVLGEQEKTDLIGLRLLRPICSSRSYCINVSTICDFNVINGMTASDMAEEFYSLYLKVADSNPFMLMTEEDNRREDLLLSIGITPESSPIRLSDSDKLLLSATDDAAMRRIMLHSNETGIYKYVMDGALRCSIRIPALNVNALVRFNSHYLYSGKSPDDDMSIINERIDEDETLTDAERNICAKFIRVWHLYRQHAVKRADFAALYKLLRYTDYDELMLRHALRRLHFIKRSARLLAVLGERYGLTEGYMFMPPLGDRTTKRIKRNLSRYGIQ